MGTDMGNFNFDEFQKKHEGLIQKITRWIGKHLKFLCSVGAITVIIGCIELYILCNTSDAGKIIGQIYEEMKENSDEINYQASLVVLPDSLEDEPDVMKIRNLQNNIRRIAEVRIAFLSEVKELINTSDTITTLTNRDVATDLMKSFKSLFDLFDPIIKNEMLISESFVEYVSTPALTDKDTITNLIWERPQTLKNYLELKKLFYIKIKELDKTSRNYIKKMNATPIRKRKHVLIKYGKEINVFFSDPLFKKLMASFRDLNLIYMKSSNSRLLYLKNKWTEEKIKATQEEKYKI